VNLILRLIAVGVLVACLPSPDATAQPAIACSQAAHFIDVSKGSAGPRYAKRSCRFRAPTNMSSSKATASRISVCLFDKVDGRVALVVGYAFDGYPILGPFECADATRSARSAVPGGARTASAMCGPPTNMLKAMAISIGATA
jgi:hypothetical protein